jgi:hypothetical protein
MPNAVYSFHDVNKDFRRAGMTLLHSRMWTEAPLNNFKLTHIYPDADYMGGNKIHINKINQSLNLGRIPYKSELVYDSMPTERSATGRSQPVKPREKMERRIELGVLPNDNKATLDDYLDKLKANIEKLEQYQSRIPFATGQMLIDAQIRRLVSLETTISPTDVRSTLCRHQQQWLKRLRSYSRAKRYHHHSHLKTVRGTTLASQLMTRILRKTNRIARTLRVWAATIKFL